MGICYPRAFLILSILGVMSLARVEAAPHVVVSIAPLHSLVAGVMAGVSEPDLLVKGGSSPHGYILKPSQVRSMQRADMIVWVGESLEGFLPRVLANLDKDKAILESMEIPGLTVLPTRKGGVWESGHEMHGHDDHHDHHEHGDTDGHLWLDPDNAKIIVRILVTELSKIDPQHAQQYKSNGETMQQALTELDHQLEQMLAPVRQRPYLVFHDAYQYFEHAYELNSVGAVMVDPERKPGARRLSELRDKIQASNARCVFSEPQFPKNIIGVVIEGTTARSASLDPIGISLEPGKDLYFDLMTELGKTLADCLANRG